jgi:phage-related protein
MLALMRTVKLLFHSKALKEFKKLNRKVRNRFNRVFTFIVNKKKLPRSKFKKITGTNLFEVRIRSNKQAYRGIGGFIKPNFAIVLFFKKKSQKIPQKELRKAICRISELL